MKWPYNFIYAVTHENVSELPGNIEDVIEKILDHYKDNRARDILWRRFHNYEMCKDIANSYSITDSRIATVIRESCAELNSIYHDWLIYGTMPDEVKLTEDSDIDDVMMVGLDMRTYNCITRHLRRCNHNCAMNGVKIKDIVNLYNEKYYYKFSSNIKSNGLMDIRHMGKVSYDNITRILKEYGFIDGEIDKFNKFNSD